MLAETPAGYVRLDEAAQYLGLTPELVKQHIRTGELAATLQPRGSREYEWFVALPGHDPAGVTTPTPRIATTRCARFRLRSKNPFLARCSR